MISVESTTASQEASVQKINPFEPAIAWRRGYANLPGREPTEMDVQDGRAEYLLTGPYRLAEGSKIEVVNGQVLWMGGRSFPR